MRTTTLARTVGRLLVVVAACIGVALPAGAAYAAGPSTTILRVPLDASLFLPCANGGSGEVVHLTGTFMGVTHVTRDGAGGIHVSLLEVEQGVSGVGLTTGDHYVSSFVNRFSFNQGTDSLPLTSTQEVAYRVNGPGPGNESLIRISGHTTVDANGTMTVAFDNFSAECLATEP